MTKSSIKSCPAGGHRRRRIAGLLAGLLCGAAATATAQTTARDGASAFPAVVRQDLADRAADIRWPEGFSPAEADMFSHNAIRISASCDRVWKQLIDAAHWPDFYPNGKDVQFQEGGSGTGELKLGTAFRWQTFGQSWDTRVHEFVPSSRIGWFGYAPGSRQPVAYHAWLLKPSGEACLVATDEVGKGAGAIKVRQTDPGLMHRGHDLWLAGLRFVAEKPGA